MLQKFYFLLFFLFTSASLLANDTQVDSLKSIVKKGDSHQQIAVLNQLFDIYIHTNPDTAFYYLQQAIKLSSQNNSAKEKVACYFRFNSFLLNKGDYAKGIKYLDTIIELATQIGDSSTIAEATNKKAYNFYRSGNYNKALEYSIEGIHLNQLLKDKKGEYDALNTSGNVYTELGNYKKSLACFKQNYELALVLKDDKSIATALNNIGLSYQGLKNNKDALDCFLNALPYSVKVGKDWEAASYLNIGLSYATLKQNNKAIQYFQKTITICTEINFQMGIVYANNYLGDLFNDSKNYVEAKTHLEIALAIAEKMNVKPQLKDTYRSLSNTYRGLNDYKKADEYFQLFSQTKDSLLNESTSKQITEMQTKYETETKEKEILLLNTDKKLKDTELAQRRIVEYFLTGVGVLILLLALMLFKANQNKQKANELLTQQKQEISAQRDLIEEQKNVVVHQKKEITDSINYAQRIQHAIHAPIAEIKTHLPDSFVYYKPKDIVSGDFYWFDCKGDICYIAAADCTGHGIPGALMTMLGTLLINEITNSKKILEPAGILKNLNYLLNITFRQDKILDGMDIALCALNIKTNELKYAGANRPLWIIKRTENALSSPTNTAFELEELKADKTAIGGYNELDYEYTNNISQLKKGDSFYIFSDGYIDQFGGEKGKKLTTKRFREKILSLQNESMQEQETHLHEYITNWRNTLEQVDDLLVIGVRV